jgi:Rne/Rng family ribonuclease
MAKPETTRLFVAERGEERHVALWRRGRLAGYRIDAPGLQDRSGAVFLGQVVRIDSGLGSAFVTFDRSASGSPETGLLALRRGEKRVEGDRLLVQLVQDRRGEKSARLTAAPILDGRFIDLLTKESGVHMMGEEMAPEMARALRSALRSLAAKSQIGLRLTPRAAHASAESIVKEATTLAASWQSCTDALTRGGEPGCLRRPAGALLALLQELASGEPVVIVADNRTLARRIEAELVTASVADPAEIQVLPQRDWAPSAVELDESVRAALDPRASLAGGGWILFEPGETLTAIDVNSGAASARRAGASRVDLRLKVNLQAVDAIAHELRLRAIGGLVVIDFVDMESSADRDRVVKALKAALADDPARIRVLPMSDLGLVQMTRQRRGPSLAELFFGPCEPCGGTGRLALRRPIGNSPL